MLGGPQIADFGMSKILRNLQTHVSTNTFGASVRYAPQVPSAPVDGSVVAAMTWLCFAWEILEVLAMLLSGHAENLMKKNNGFVLHGKWLTLAALDVLKTSGYLAEAT